MNSLDNLCLSFIILFGMFLFFHCKQQLKEDGIWMPKKAEENKKEMGK